jgi:hypothetical protein
MADTNQLTRDEHILEEPRKMPEMINVLSILTFIGSGLVILVQLYYFTAAKKIYDASMAGQEKIDQAPAFVRSMQGSDPIGVIQRTYDNRVPIGLLNLVAAVLCIIGAMQMRKLKKTGFYIYLIGEVLPLLVTYIFIGAAALSGIGLLFSLLFTALFIILYATQIKYLKS